MESWLENFARANFQRSSDTAHDLKTPLNVAVLNLELLRMRLRKLTGAEEDAKVAGYVQAIDVELRRMGRIFDAFFLLSTPPGNEGPPSLIDVAPLVSAGASAVGFTVEVADAAPVEAHDSRIRQAIRLFFEGAAKLFGERTDGPTVTRDASRFTVIIEGRPQPTDFELTKLFKFYYSDAGGNPDLTLAVARLIAETYGGELDGSVSERDKVTLRLSFPLGAR